MIEYEDAEDLGALSERDERLVRTGVAVPASYFYERYQIPEPEKGEAVVGGRLERGLGSAPLSRDGEFAEGDVEPRVVADAGVEQARDIYAAWIGKVIEQAAEAVPE